MTIKRTPRARAPQTGDPRLDRALRALAAMGDVLAERIERLEAQAKTPVSTTATAAPKATQQTLAGLFDVSLSAPSVDDLLIFDGIRWINATVDAVQALMALVLDDLGDVAISSPVVGHVLQHNGTQWVNAPAGAAGLALDDLTDVAIAAPASGHIIRHNGSEWVNISLLELIALTQLSDVLLTAPTSGQFLRYNGTNWVNISLNEVLALTNLSDVTVAAPASGNILLYNGSEWVNTALAELIALTNLSDVTISAPAAGHVLRYNGTIWVNATLAEFLGLTNLSDVTITTPAAGNILRYSGSEWVNVALAELIGLTDLSDVTLSGVASGHILRHNGTAFVNVALAELIGITDLSDVTISAASTGQVLRYNGSAWVNAQVTESGIADDAVTAAKIAANAVGSSELADDAVDTAAIQNNAVTDAKLRDSAALSVIGRASNSSGDPADIAGVTDGHALRISGTTLGFGTIATAGLGDDQVTDAKLRESAALSVIGRSANSTGNPADIAAASDAEVLRRSGTSLGFGTVATAGLADNAVTDGKLRDSAARSVIGRSAATSGDPADITASADGQVLQRAAGVLAFAVSDGLDGTAIHDNVSAEISAITEKTAPTKDDWLLIEDAAASNAKKRVAFSQAGGFFGSFKKVVSVSMGSPTFSAGISTLTVAHGITDFDNNFPVAVWGSYYQVGLPLRTALPGIIYVSASTVYILSLWIQGANLEFRCNQNVSPAVIRAFVGYTPT